MMTNWEGFGRKWSWPIFKVPTRQSPGGTEKNNEKSVRIAGCWSRTDASVLPTLSVCKVIRLVVLSLHYKVG
jgi:hypothetical protein